MMQKVRGRTSTRRCIVLPLLVDAWFQDLLTPLPGFFSPFPHGTSSLSVTGEYLVLDNGQPRFPQDFKCPVVLRNVLAAFVNFAYGSITLFAPASHQCSAINSGPLYTRPTTPCEALSGELGTVPIFAIFKNRNRPLFSLIKASHGLDSSLFARTTGGISIDFSSCGY